MKSRILFFFVCSCYLALSITGTKTNSYTDIEYFDYFLYNKGIIFLIVLALIIGSAMFYWGTKLFPGGYPKNIFSYVFLPIGFAILSFMFNKGIVKLINSSFGKQQKIMIQGHIRWKYIEPRRGVDAYFIEVIDTVVNTLYKFKVDEGAYLSNELQGVIGKEFTIGSLGIIYRKNE